MGVCTECAGLYNALHWCVEAPRSAVGSHHGFVGMHLVVECAGCSVQHNNCILQLKSISEFEIL